MVGRLRDLGAPRRRRLERRPAVSRLDRRQPCCRARRAWPPDARAGGTTWSGPGKPIDTDQYFVVCANVLGGCQGSTGPASPHPVDGEPYGSRFPVVTIRDMVRAQAQLAEHLGVSPLDVGDRRLDGRDAGARVGGDVSTRVRLARRGRHVHAGHRAADRVGRHRPSGDPARPEVARRRLLRRRARRRPGRGARDRPHGRPGHVPQRQRVHRPIRARTRRQGRRRATRSGMWQQFEVERYLEYHGVKLVRRFDTNSYLAIGKAMDLHDVARGRGSLERAMLRVQLPTMAVGIWSDMLYPAYQQQQIHDAVAANGVASEYFEIDSPHGHDAFLINSDQLAGPLERFLGDAPVKSCRLTTDADRAGGSRSRDLAPTRCEPLVGRTIVGCRRRRTGRAPTVSRDGRHGATIDAVRRRGKVVLLDTDGADDRAALRDDRPPGGRRRRTDRTTSPTHRVATTGVGSARAVTRPAGPRRTARRPCGSTTLGGSVASRSTRISITSGSTSMR